MNSPMFEKEHVFLHWLALISPNLYTKQRIFGSHPEVYPRQMSYSCTMRVKPGIKAG